MKTPAGYATISGIESHFHCDMKEMIVMKKKVLISLLAAVCVLWLTACAKAPEQTAESKEDTTVSQQSEVIPTDTKIEASPVSQPEELSPLTLEQVKKVIFTMTAQQDLSVGVDDIVAELNKVQEGYHDFEEYPKRGRGVSTYTYDLFDGDEPTNNTIVVKEYGVFPEEYGRSRAGYIFYDQYDSNGELLNEEVLYQNLDQLYDLLPMEKVQEVLAESEKVEKPAKHQNKYIHQELSKYQTGNRYYWVKDAIKSEEDIGTYFWVRSGENDQLTWLVLMMPSALMDSRDSYEGDTIVYLEKMDMNFNTISKEIIYEAKHDA